MQMSCLICYNADRAVLSEYPAGIRYILFGDRLCRVSFYILQKAHINLHSAAFQLAAQIVMKVFQLSTLCCKIVCEKLNYKAREEEL